MKITGIIITNLSEFVITSKNKSNSKFFIRPKSDFERELELIKENNKKIRPIVISSVEGWENETKIIAMINTGTKFYTYDYINKIFTEVVVVNNNIKSKSNETDKDNISELPVPTISLNI